MLRSFSKILPRIGFAAQRPSDYVGSGPDFFLPQQLDGDLISEGLIYGPTGRVVSRFVADMRGDWTGPTARLTEDFTFASGTTQHRAWALQLKENGAFTATAPDIIGQAHGQIEGATARMTYRLRLSEDAGGHVLNVVDWMYLLDNGTILNRSQMRKFGIKVAELVATIRPAQPVAYHATALAGQ
ncbi:DUF3833 domain-containing protein [Cognatishimia sp. WU-CL00825]|uniref:DUF3833 domain-containing protein n=1 Tax=Cognatishimia sp. WU-CL00825 TaxID=3127658 RepID=UPI003105740C